MKKCNDCGNMQDEDLSGVDGFCIKCGSEDIKNVKEEQDFDFPEHDSPLEMANDILKHWGE